MSLDIRIGSYLKPGENEKKIEQSEISQITNSSLELNEKSGKNN